ncbi:MAG TPA: ribosome maturation factor RimP [Rhodospirillaceae bacterium]|nr:MAG: hypothetical protein A2018_07225 [Alphaproteobacteria bacterium GWF2_58_20]HAU29266.1 ribosome maturation factor RimP [Rhodospirillaceae bacterium]
MAESHIKKLENIIIPAVEALGYDVVRLLMNAGTLQVMAEPLDGRIMTIEDCTLVSRALSALLDVEDPIAETYMLEISSPGLERPLRTKDFPRFAGLIARVETTSLLDGRRRFTGPIRACNAEGVVIETDDGPVHIPFTAMAKARLTGDEAMPSSSARKKAEKKNNRKQKLHEENED